MMGPLMVALCLLGLGWSACLIGGSALLVEAAPARVRVPLQGASDSMMNLGAALLAAAAGPLLALGGFVAVNAMGLTVLVCLAAVGVRAPVRRPVEPAAQPATEMSVDSPPVL